jgi:hypothetical protein
MRENHKAEEMANGIVELQNQRRRYFIRTNTLDEQLTPKEDDF